MITFIILIIFLISGFACLSYEIVWVKQLSLIFGVSSHAITTVISAFMGGLALGSYLMGRWADRKKSSLWIYVILEIGIAVSALLFPYILRFINNLFILLTQYFTQFSPIFIIIRFLLCFLALLISTTLMGATLPAISKYFTKNITSVGNRIGLLYSMNTIGGVLGCFVTGFIMLRFVGANMTTWIAASLNILAAITASLIASFYKEMPIHTSLKSIKLSQKERKKRIVLSENQLENINKQSIKRFLIIAYGIAGFTSLAYEVLWTRVLVYILGNDTYAFTTILSTFLFGIALGSYVSAHFVDRNKNLVLSFGLLQLGIGFTSSILLSTLGKGFIQGSSFDTYVNFGKSSVLILIPTLLMGAVFPIIIKMYSTNINKLGGNIGDIYAVNTIGGIIGSLTAGFILLSLFGAQQSIILISFINIILGMIAITLIPIQNVKYKKISIIALPLIIIIILSAKNIKPTVIYGTAYCNENLKEILYYHEDVDASLSVLKGQFNERGLNINGETTAYTNFHDLLVHKMLAHVPVLLSEEPDNSLVIGFGLGSTAYSFTLYPLKQIDCVELVPMEKKTAKYFLDENNHIMNNPRFNFITADGRNYLKTCNVKYDIISMNAIHPKISPYLYTKEFYQLCKNKLSNKGVMCAWLPTNIEYFSSCINTFQEVFPFASLWFCNFGHMVLIGTQKPLQIDFQHWLNIYNQKKIYNDLAEVLLNDPLQLLSYMIMAEDSLYQFVNNSPIQTDDLPKIEFEYFNKQNKYMIDNIVSLFSKRCDVYSYITNINNKQTAVKIKNQLDKYALSMSYAPDGWYIDRRYSRYPLDVINRMDMALYACPENKRILYDYSFIWYRWLFSNPNFIISDSTYTSRALKVQKHIIAHYESLTQHKRQSVIDRVIAPIRLSYSYLQYTQEKYTQAANLARRVLEVDPTCTLASQLYNNSVALLK